MPEENMTPSSKEEYRSVDTVPKTAPGWPLVAVQSIACGVVLLITLLFRLAGGEAYAQLQTAFSEAVADNAVMATIAALFDTGEPDTQRDSRTDTTSTTDADTSATGSTTSTTATDTTSKTSATTKAADAAVVAMAQGGNQPPEGYSFAKLQTNRAARLPLTNGVLTSGYGYRDNPTGSGEQFHGGLDIAADAGEPIYAMYFGVVVDAGESDSYGRYIRIYHGNGLEILYAHCSRIVAEIGDAVGAGDKVALVGATGDATGNHVHVEVYQNGVICDPSGLLPVTAYA